MSKAVFGTTIRMWVFSAVLFGFLGWALVNSDGPVCGPEYSECVEMRQAYEDDVRYAEVEQLESAYREVRY